MSFITYWLISILFAVWAALEKLTATIRGESMLAFWLLIVCAVFFWLAAVGSRHPPKDEDNPF